MVSAAEPKARGPDTSGPRKQVAPAPAASPPATPARRPCKGTSFYVGSLHVRGAESRPENRAENRFQSGFPTKKNNNVSLWGWGGVDEGLRKEHLFNGV